MNKTCYIYEDTFISLLNLIYYLIDNNIIPANIKNTFYSPNLLDHLVYLKIEEDTFIFERIKNTIGLYAFRSIFYVFLSSNENKEIIIYYLLLNGLKYKEKILLHRDLNCVNQVIKISNNVVHESHKYKGFIRFKKLKNNVLYTSIAPENNVLNILSNHFQKRLKNEYWIIKDINRNLLSIYDKKNYYIIFNDSFTFNTTLCSEETEIEELWKTFYKTIGISERKNEKCRMNFMPKKYWKYMVEMEDII